MWSKSFRSNEFSTQDIDLMEEASGVASSSNHDVKEDAVDSMLARPSKRSRSQINDRNFVHFLRTAVHAQTQETSEQ